MALNCTPSNCSCSSYLCFSSHLLHSFFLHFATDQSDSLFHPLHSMSILRISYCPDYFDPRYYFINLWYQSPHCSHGLWSKLVHHLNQQPNSFQPPFPTTHLPAIATILLVFSPFFHPQNFHNHFPSLFFFFLFL